MLLNDHWRSYANFVNMLHVFFCKYVLEAPELAFIMFCLFIMGRATGYNGE